MIVFSFFKNSAIVGFISRSLTCVFKKIWKDLSPYLIWAIFLLALWTYECSHNNYNILGLPIFISMSFLGQFQWVFFPSLWVVLFCFYGNLVISNWMPGMVEWCLFLSSHKHSWVLFRDAVKLIGNSLVLLGLVFKVCSGSELCIIYG